MSKKYLLLLIVAIALILTSYFVFVKLTPKGPVKYPVETYISFVDQCKPEGTNANLAYNMCCEKDGKSYDCTNRREFSQDEFVVIRADLNEMLTDVNVPFDSFYACGYSTLIEFLQLPAHYSSHTFITINSSNTEFIGCGNFSINDTYHIITEVGLVPHSKDVKLLEVRLFPISDKVIDFRKDLDKSILIFNLTGVVR